MRLLDYSDIHTVLDSGATIVCASDRLWRMFSAKHTLAYPKLESFYLPRFLDSLIESDLTQQLPMTAMQTLVECKRAIDTSIKTPEDELSTIGLAKKFKSAISTMIDYDIVMDELQFNVGHETSRFIEWNHQLTDSLKRSGDLLPSTAYMNLLSQIENDQVDLPNSVCLIGFIETPPFLQRFVQALEDRGTEVTGIEFPFEADSDTAFVKTSNEFDESRLAAKWLRNQIQKAPKGNFALVVPEVDKYRDIVNSAFMEVFEKGYHGQAKPWVFAGGMSLIEYPLVYDAVSILKVTQHADIETWSKVILSPYINGINEERNLRSKIDLEIRKIPKRRLYLHEVIEITQRLYPDSIIHQNLSALREVNESLPDIMSSTNWTTSFERLLNASGWLVNRSLNSEEHQTQASFWDCLCELASLDHQMSSIRIGAAQGWLEEILRSKRFQPEVSASTPITVLSHWDSLCVKFDAAWVLSLTSEALPQSHQPTPFIPLHLQRNAEVVETDYELLNTRHEKQALYLSQLGRKTVLSYPAKFKDIEQTFSPYITGFETAIELNSIVEGSEHTPQLIELSDTLPSITPQEESELKGIVSIIKDYSHDPLTAQLKHRFKVEAFPRVQIGLTPAIAGTITQSVLEIFWNDVKDKVTLDGYSDAVLANKVSDCVEQAFNSNQNLVKYIGKKEAQLEMIRIRDLVLNWIEQEKERDHDFVVVGNEVSAEVKLGNKVFNVSIDRMDRVETDTGPQLLTMDHKTGRDLNASGMLPDSLKEPQLPLYTLATINGKPLATDGIALCHVRDGAMKSSVIAGFETGLPKYRTSTESADTWSECLSHWRPRIELAYDAFIQADITRMGEPNSYDDYLSPLL